MTPFGPGRAETRTVSIAAPPERVVTYLADARHLPDWAPDFAPAITHERDDIWCVATDAGQQRLAVRAAPAHGVVDFVSADAPGQGLFTRVVPNLAGAELIFSLSFPPEAGEPAVEAQMAVVERELSAVRERVESGAA
jgi:uncharacterized protein YndB with AHSA1/START domain